MINVNEIPEIPGIYELNGKINYAMNLRKKAKKIKGEFKILKEMPDATFQDVQKEIYKKAQEVEKEDKIVLHHYVNRKTGWSITSIYNNLKIDDYEQID